MVYYKGIVYKLGLPNEIVDEIISQFINKVKLAGEDLTEEEREIDGWLKDSKWRDDKLKDGESIEYWLQSSHNSLFCALEWIGYKLQSYRAIDDEKFCFWKAYSQFFLSKLEFVKRSAEKCEFEVSMPFKPDPHIGKISCEHPIWPIWEKEIDLDYVPRDRSWMNPKWQEEIYWCVECPIKSCSAECGDVVRSIQVAQVLLSSARKGHSQIYKHTHFQHLFPARLSFVPHFQIQCPQKCGLRFIPESRIKNIDLTHCPKCQAEFVTLATYRTPNFYGQRVCHDCTTSFRLDRYRWPSQGFFCSDCLEKKEDREKKRMKRRKSPP